MKNYVASVRIYRHEVSLNYSKNSQNGKRIMEESSYALYAVSFSQGDTVRVVILEAEDTAKAEIYVRDAFGEQLTNVKIKTIDIIGTGIIQCVYEKKESK